MEGSGNVKMVRAQSEDDYRIKVVTDDNIMKLIKTEVSGSVLRIYFDQNQNVMVKSIEASIDAPVETYNTQSSLVYSHDKPIAVVGLKNVAVVDTGKGILVCDRKQSNDVKKIVQSLKDKGLEDYI